MGQSRAFLGWWVACRGAPPAPAPQLTQGILPSTARGPGPLVPHPEGPQPREAALLPEASRRRRDWDNEQQCHRQPAPPFPRTCTCAQAGGRAGALRHLARADTPPHLQLQPLPQATREVSKRLSTPPGTQTQGTCQRGRGGPGKSSGLRSQPGVSSQPQATAGAAAAHCQPQATAGAVAAHCQPGQSWARQGRGLGASCNVPQGSSDRVGPPAGAAGALCRAPGPRLAPGEWPRASTC